MSPCRRSCSDGVVWLFVGSEGSVKATRKSSSWGSGSKREYEGGVMLREVLARRSAAALPIDGRSRLPVWARTWEMVVEALCSLRVRIAVTMARR